MIYILSTSDRGHVKKKSNYGVSAFLTVLVGKREVLGELIGEGSLVREGVDESGHFVFKGGIES